MGGKNHIFPLKLIFTKPPIQKLIDKIAFRFGNETAMGKMSYWWLDNFVIQSRCTVFILGKQKVQKSDWVCQNISLLDEGYPLTYNCSLGPSILHCCHHNQQHHHHHHHHRHHHLLKAILWHIIALWVRWDAALPRQLLVLPVQDHITTPITTTPATTTTTTVNTITKVTMIIIFITTTTIIVSCWAIEMEVHDKHTTVFTMHTPDFLQPGWSWAWCRACSRGRWIHSRLSPPSSPPAILTSIAVINSIEDNLWKYQLMF